MKGLSDILAEAYAAWLDSVSACCAPLASCLDNRKPTRRGRTSFPYTGVDDGSLSRAGAEKHADVLYGQPELVSPPSADPLRQHPTTAARQRGGRGFSSAGSARKGGFSARTRFGSNASSRRPHISAPSNFRHLYSESFQFPPQQQQRQRQRRQRPASFRPLELSIYVAEKQLSPILPHFGHSPSGVSPPPPAHTASSREDDSSSLAHTKSYSSTMSFHIPRRQLSEEGSVSTTSTDSPPRIPPRARGRAQGRGRGRGRGRARAHTSPSVEGMVERIASAMIERDRLQAEIESLMERQSICVSSRPSTAYGAPEDLEPMPSIPALPAAAPSFAERLSIDRPRTSPPRVQETPPTALATPPRRTDPAVAGDHPLDRPLAPPLPLVLRPPLRKKKSFSHVSNWLFPNSGEAQHSREISLESVTNAPRPVARGDGYYQCMPPPPGEGARGSTGSSAASTLSGWESQEDERTVPTTTWSPGSSPATTRPEMPTPSSTVSHVGTFGCGRVQAPRPTSVGVAF